MVKKYTIQDIAEASGVSRGTVSRVLNNHHAVSEKTRQAVLSVIEELNYRPNFSARHMRTASSNLVGFGLIGDEVITSPYAVDMIRGAQDTLWLSGKVMLTTSGGYESQMTRTAFEAMLERRVEGIIYAAVFHRPVELPFDPGETPIVFANCYSKDRKYPSVVPDEFGGGYTATQTLIEAGHRRIAFINLGVPHVGLTPRDAANGRFLGYQQALQDYAIPLDETLVRHTNFLTETNYQLTNELMHQPNAPTAIFCGTDRIAMGCYLALISMGLKIPDDVAVIGYDNQQDIGSGLIPGLTTIQLPHYEMGLWAVEYLSQYPKDGSEPPIQHKMPCPLVRRKSV
jgi:LacI family transcriptional regulator